MKYETRILKVGVMLEGREIHDDGTFTVEIANEGVCEFVVLSHIPEGMRETVQIPIDVTEWPTLRKAIDDMVKRCKK